MEGEDGARSFVSLEIDSDGSCQGRQGCQMPSAALSLSEVRRAYRYMGISLCTIGPPLLMVTKNVRVTPQHHFGTFCCITI